MTPRTDSFDVAMIVPAFRDTDAVRALLDSTERWTPPPSRIIVVSGEPDPVLAHLVAERGHVCVDGPLSRGAQLDLGARAAHAHVLWFVHADADVPTDAIAAIGRALASGAESGCFRFAFQGPPAWRKTLIERLVALRLRAGGTAYGDQALFASRRAYEACGGFAAQPLFEEVALVRRLKRRGTFRVLPQAVGVSPRRWERDGWVRRTLHNRWLALRFALGTPAERLAGAYARPAPRRARADPRRMPP